MCLLVCFPKLDVFLVGPYTKDSVNSGPSLGIPLFMETTISGRLLISWKIFPAVAPQPSCGIKELYLEGWGGLRI